MPAALVALLVLTGPAASQAALAGPGTPLTAEERVERESYVMGTRLAVRISAPGDASAAAEAALAAVRRAEDVLSTWRPDTDLARLNRAPVGQRHVVSPAVLETLLELGAWVEATDRAFDPAIGALLEAWNVRGESRMPPSVELAAAQKASGWHRLMIEPSRSAVTRTVRGVELDAGAFGKGLALRQAVASLRAARATGTLNFGGQIVVIGPGIERIDVADAAVRDRAVATLAVANGSVATASLSERSHHILDPRTGQPAPDWGSVTVVAEDAMVADILSTALYVMGPEAALDWASDRPYGVLIQETGADPRIAWNPAMERWLSRSPEGAIGPVWRPTDAAAAMPARSGGPGAAPQDTSELDRLKRQVEAITRELERMRLGGDVVTRADTGVLGFGPAASKVYTVDEGVSIGGYGEVLYRMVSDELEDGTESPTVNRFDALRAILYVGYKFNDRLLINTEIELEHANEAFLEFAYLDYRLSDAVGLRGGLLLSPMGLVNELHEPPVFLGTTRPLVERSIIPTTWRENGLGVFGDVGPISYRVYGMNGLQGVNFSAGGLRGGRQKGSNALAEDVAVVVRADYTGVLGLLLGGSVYYGGSGQGVEAAGEVVQANTLIWEGHASYQSRGLDLRALVAGATVDEAVELHDAALLADPDATPVSERLGGGYAHVGYDVLRGTGSPQQLFPFVRYEWVNTQVEVPEGVTADPANDRTAVLVGASWKPVPQVAVKGDYQVHSNGAETGRNQFALVLSYLF